MRAFVIRGTIWSGLGCLVGTLTWAVLGAIVVPVLMERVPIATALVGFPSMGLYLGTIAAITGGLLFLPYALLLAVIEWLRSKSESSLRGMADVARISLILALPPAFGVAYSFGVRFSAIDIDWSQFGFIFPLALVTFWSGAAAPVLLLPVLRTPARRS